MRKKNNKGRGKSNKGKGERGNTQGSEKDRWGRRIRLERWNMVQKYGQRGTKKCLVYYFIWLLLMISLT